MSRKPRKPLSDWLPHEQPVTYCCQKMRKKEERERAVHRETGLVTGRRAQISNLSSKWDYMRLEKSIYTPMRGGQGKQTFPPRTTHRTILLPQRQTYQRSPRENSIYPILLPYLLPALLYLHSTNHQTTNFSTTPLPDYLYSEIDNWFISSVYSDLRFLRD